MPEPSILDERLAEIDRRLRMIQSGLAPVPDAPPASPVHAPAPEPEHGVAVPASELGPLPPPAPPPVPEPRTSAVLAELRELTRAHERLLAATQDLLVEHADVLARAAPSIAVSAGPFSDTAELRAFEQAVARLPQVRRVAVREYAGTEHAVLDVHLHPPTS